MIKLTVQNRQGKVSVVPSVTALVIKALNEPERDQKKTKNIKHNGNILRDYVIEIAKVMKPRSMAKDFFFLISMAKDLSGLWRRFWSLGFALAFIGVWLVFFFFFFLRIRGFATVGLAVGLMLVGLVVCFYFLESVGLLFDLLQFFFSRF